jgi:hypothetical protein
MRGFWELVEEGAHPALVLPSFPICPGRLGGALKLKRAYGERYPDHAATDTWDKQGTVTGVSNAIAKS